MLAVNWSGRQEPSNVHDMPRLPAKETAPPRCSCRSKVWSKFPYVSNNKGKDTSSAAPRSVKAHPARPGFKEPSTWASPSSPRRPTLRSLHRSCCTRAWVRTSVHSSAPHNSRSEARLTANADPGGSRTASSPGSPELSQVIHGSACNARAAMSNSPSNAPPRRARTKSKLRKPRVASFPDHCSSRVSAVRMPFWAWRSGHDIW